MYLSLTKKCCEFFLSCFQYFRTCIFVLNCDGIFWFVIYKAICLNGFLFKGKYFRAQKFSRIGNSRKCNMCTRENENKKHQQSKITSKDRKNVMKNINDYLGFPVKTCEQK